MAAALFSQCETMWLGRGCLERSKVASICKDEANLHA
jgi:hypothetical protein